MCKAKYLEKYFGWQVIDEFGNVSFSTLCFWEFFQCRVYLKERIKKRLLPFIDKHHATANVIFWPVMTTSHYANKVTHYMLNTYIKFIKKNENAANVPQARRIETFWSLCKRASCKPKNFTAFILRKLAYRVFLKENIWFWVDMQICLVNYYTQFWIWYPLISSHQWEILMVAHSIWLLKPVWKQRVAYSLICSKALFFNLRVFNC